MDTSRISTLGMSPEQRRALYLLLRKRGVDVFAHLPIPRVSRERPLPLSAAQRRLWLFWKLNPESSAYHITGALRLRAEIDVTALRAALTQLLQRHEALRTTFTEIDGEPLQRVVAAGPAELLLERLPAEATRLQLSALITQLAAAPFDLTRAPLVRCAVLRGDGASAVFVITLHHIAADAWSLDVLLRELMQLYAAQRTGVPAGLPELPIQYLDYAQWHETWLAAGESARQSSYFLQQLSAAEPGPLPLPIDRSRPVQQSHRGAAMRGRIPLQLSAALLQLAQRQGVSLYVLLLAIFAVWLSRLTGRRLLVVGTPIANRTRTETHGVVGFFVNTQALSLDVDTRASFLDVLCHVKKVALGAQAHSEVPFDRLVDALKPERNLAYHPLFQVMFNHLQDAGADAPLASGLQLEALTTPTTTTQFDLTLDTQLDAERQIRLSLEYATDLFEPRSAERLLACYIKLAQALTDDPRRALREITLVEAPACSSQPMAAAEPVPVAIARRCAQQREATALCCGEEHIRYGELERRVSQLAARLRAHGAAAERVVAVLCDRSLDALIAQLAVLRAGAVLLPLDQGDPPARLQEMLQLAACSLLLTAAPVELAGVATLDWHASDDQHAQSLPSILPEQLAYVLFTSGSTGRPKAVAVSHGALARQVVAVSAQYALQTDDVFLQFSALSFDAALEQWLVPLCAGAQVAMRPQELWTPPQLVAAVERHGITRLDLPPGYAGELARFLATQARRPAVRSCTVGGEALARETLALLRETMAGADVFNAYGPTEAVITPLCWRAEGQPHAAYAPIGQPLAGRRAYVLDADLNLVPKGVQGELYIAGDALARGYLHRPRETAERFVPNPFAACSRMYRTGDVVRVGSDGALQYLGRSDGQVKLRGHRVELGEIESRLLAQPGVRAAAALIRDGAGGSPQLLAYVSGDALDAQSLMAALARALPRYMVPAHVLVLDALPRLSNGKLDARALPSPSTESPLSAAAPEGAREQLLAELFRTVLGTQGVDCNASFFALGGDSILVLQLCSRARERGFELAAREVFEHQSVRELARVLRPLNPQLKAAEEAEPLPAEIALTPIQVDFFRTPMRERHHYNQSVLLASDAALDGVRLSAALQCLVRRHDALRLRFEERDGTMLQWCSAQTGELLRQAYAADAAALTSLCEEVQRSLDLAQGPLFRALYVRMADGSSRLLLCAHHLIVDGVSFRILLGELARAYTALERGSEPQLPAATTSFARWSHRLHTFARADALEPARRAFLTALAQPASSLRAPAQGARRTRLSEAGRVVTALDRESTERLLRAAPGAYRTQGAELLLAALTPVLCEHAGARAVLVEVEGHGRAAPFAGVDLSGSVGWFTTLHPMPLKAASDWGACIKAVKESVRTLSPHAVSYGVLRELRGELTQLPRPGLTFNYLGQFDAELSRGALHVASESRGLDQSPDCPLQNGLEINGQVFDGQLTLVWSFDPALYSTQEIATLAERYERSLRALIEHCDAGVCLGLTPSDVPLAQLTQGELDALPMAADMIEDVYPLTPLQQGLLFHQLDAPERGTYVNQLDVHVSGLAPAQLEAAWQRLLERHSVLRTAFAWEELSHPVQIVLRKVHDPIELRDLRAHAPAELGPALRALCEQEHARGLTLTRAPLARFVVAALPDGTHQLIWTTHHLLLDGWSNARLIGELLSSYEGSAPRGAPVPFRRYLQWLAERPSEVSERFWRAELAQSAGPTHIASAAPPCRRGQGRGVLRVQLEAAALNRLRERASSERVTLGTLLEAAFGVLLAAYTGQSRVMFGVTVSGRPASLPDAEHMLGLFINTIPSLQRIERDASLGDHLRSLQRAAAARREHEHTPLAQLARWADQPGRPLFDCLLVFENYPVAQALSGAAGSLRFGPARSVESTDFPLTLSIHPGETLALAVEYARESFDEESASALCQRFLHIVQQLGAAEVVRVSDVSALLPAERDRLAALSCRPHREPPRGFVHEWIAARAQRSPDAVALVCGPERLSYRELATRADSLAAHLQQRGVRPDERIGIALPRSVDLIVAVLGVLRAGAAYVPLDPAYPVPRLQQMAAEAQLRLLISTRALDGGLPACPRVWIEDVPVDRVALRPRLHPEHLAYLIFTSGSTGKPKAVAVAHGALAMHLAAAAELYGLGQGDAALHLASISFDAAVEQWAVPLMSGAKLVLHREGEEAPEALHALALREAVSLIYPPTSHLHALAQHQAGLPAHARRLQLRLCTVGGEAVSRDTLLALRSTFGTERVINGYGPTETVITPLLWQAHADTPVESAYAPIGQLVGERTAVILNAALEPVAPGVLGELYIAGEGLARGYHAAPRLTAERFLPALHAPSERMYRTGDLVRMLPSGALEFVGRVDAQIKLRGYRIEPAEIEAALLAVPGVSEAAVSLVQTPHKRLVAHVAAHSGELTEPALLQQLRAALPAHMVPARVLILTRLPRTPNGKVDRAALPDAEASAVRFAPPQGRAERALAQLWMELLSVPQVGRQDNFFELGGDSIVSIQLIGRACRLGLALTTRQVFEHPTLHALARVAKPLAAAVSSDARAEGAVPLTPIQAAFFARPLRMPGHYNQALLLQPKAALDRAALSGALKHVLEHHDALRLRFTMEDGAVHQRYAPHASAVSDVLWQRTAQDGVQVEQLCQEVQRSLDLARGPLLRALHLQLSDGSERLLLCVHHLVMDAVSFRILLEDLESSYRAFARLRVPPQLQRTSSFQRHAAQLAQFAREVEQTALPAWQALLTGDRGQLASEPAAIASPGRASLHMELDAAQTERLLRGTAHAYHTRIDDLLLCALTQTLCTYAGTRSIRVALEGHGRQPLSEALDLTRTIGWFTSLYPVQLTAADDAATAIQTVKEQLRALPHQGLSYGALRWLGRDACRARLRELPAPQVLFNYLGQLDASLDAGHALFTPAPESSGDDADPALPMAHVFEINADIVAGRLRVEWAYCPALHAEATVRGLLDTYTTTLLALIDHCSCQQRSTWTPSDVPLAGLDAAALQHLAARAQPASDAYRLTPLQQGMLYHALSTPEADVYVTQLAVDLRGLDEGGIARLRAAWQGALDAHDSLRTSFVTHGLPHPVQLVAADVALPFSIVENPGDLLELAERERLRGFDLEQAPLMRVVLARTGDSAYRMLWTSHHLLLDGWSSSLLLSEVLARFAGEQVDLAVLRFRDYVSWLAARETDASERYFRARLAQLTEPSLLGQPARDVTFGSARRTLPAELTDRLEQLSRACAGTLSSTVSAAWALVLSRVLAQPCVVFGATVSGRPPELRDVERVLGLFINTVPVISTPRAEQSVRQWLQCTAAEQLELREHEHTPLYDVQAWAGFGGPLFDSLLVFENYPVARSLRERRAELTFEAASTHETTSYALTIGVSRGEGLEIAFDYQREALAGEQVERLLASFCHVLAEFAADPQARIGSIALTLPSAAPCAPAPRPVPDCLTGFWRHAAQHPEQLALHDPARELSYGELAQRVAAAAQDLRTRGIGAESLVAVHAARSVDSVLCLLAVLAAGAGFVVLDPALPPAALERQCKCARLSLVLSSAPAGLPFIDRPVLSLDAWLEAAGRAPYQQQHTPLTAATLAYVLYTSGSTGAPKGVEVSRGALSQQLTAAAELTQIGPGDRALLFASLGFDAALEQWLLPLSRGAAVYVMHGVWSIAEMVHALEAHALTHLDLPPAYALLLARELRHKRGKLALERCTVGGEAIAASGYAELASTLAPARVINAYGPTEAVITPAAWSGEASDLGYAPIGAPLAARRAYVLDPALAPLPQGLAGELYLGGEPLARGYRDWPAATALRFLPDPLAHGQRMLRTGDRVRELPDGTLEFLGRVDQQLKVRGFRVELGEVEAALLRHSDVREAAVLARTQPGGLALYAYVVSAGADDVALHAHLQAELPEHALPSAIVLLPRLPRTAQGKLDARALPLTTEAARELVAPHTPMQQLVAAAFAAVLDRDQVGLHDNFFALGGHSLRALALVAELSRRARRQVRLADVVRHPTVEHLAARLEAPARAPARDGAAACIVTLAEGPGHAAPLFCLHPAGGTPFSYLPLARVLAPERAVHGLVCRSLLAPGHRDRSIEAMAADYAREILRVQPRGPYHLLGWSLGGVIAVHAAAALEAAGADVRSLWLVDSFVPGLGLTSAELGTEEAQSPSPHAGFDAIDLRAGRDTLAHLSALARSCGLRPLRVRARCVWSQEERGLRAHAESALDAGLGQAVHRHGEISVAHAEIVSDQRLLELVRLQLAAADSAN